MLETTDAVTPREFLKMFADVIEGGTNYDFVKMLADTIREFADENRDITWKFVVNVVDYTYAVITLLSFALEYRDMPYAPISAIISSALLQVSENPGLCRLFLPLIDYIKQNAPEFAKGVPCKCPQT